MMKSSRKFSNALAIGLTAFCGILANAVNAQTANGATATACSQSGTEVTCTTTIKYTLPVGVSIQSGNVGSGNFVLAGGGPGCSALNASPSVVSANVQTTVNLSISNCAANATFTWAAPAQSTSTSTSVHSLTLATGAQPQQYSVQVCLPGQTAAPGCQTYSTSVGLAAAVPALAGCSIAPASSTITTAGSVALAVSCSQGTGSGSGVQYQWRRNGTVISGATSSTHTALGSLGVGTYSYTVDVTNNSPSSLTTGAASVSVTQQTSGSCPSGTVVPGRTINLATAQYSNWYSANHPGDTPYVIRLEVPAGYSSVSNIGFSPYSGPGAREVSISRNPCDFSTLASSVGQPDILYIGYTQGAAANVILGEGVWYINLRSPAGGSCDLNNRTCSMNLQFTP
jgi:hypothetical protein